MQVMEDGERLDLRVNSITKFDCIPLNRQGANFLSFFWHKHPNYKCTRRPEMQIYPCCTLRGREIKKEGLRRDREDAT